MAACSNCGEDNPDRARFCMACGAALAPTRETRKTVTALFNDVVDSTSLGERLDLELLRRVLVTYFDEMRKIVERHGGEVVQFAGDAILAVFGIPIAHEDDALRAVRASCDMREALGLLNDNMLADMGVRISSRTGINTGEVFVGENFSGHNVVVADAVNVAARLEAAGDAGDIVIGNGTHELVKDQVVADELGPLDLKGKSGSVRAFRVVELKKQAASRRASPIVGRSRELTLLADALDRATQEETCHLFTLLGTPGVGKSRVVEEFVGLATGKARALQGRCLPYGDGITFWPIVEIVQAAAEITDEDSAESARSRIASLVASDDDAEVISSVVAQAIGLGEASATKEQIFWSIRKFFEALARHQPLVLVIDDVHWAQPTLLDLIDHIIDWTRGAPVLLICMARPELLENRPAWGGGKINATSILLGPLSSAECELLLSNLTGAAGMEEVARLRIMAASEGNPLFVEEMVAMLIDLGILRRVDERWVAVGDLTEVAIPRSISALLQARLDSLGEDERTVVETAAVMGKVFASKAVSELTPRELSDVTEILATLSRKELVMLEQERFAGEETFQFRHILIRDAAYEAIPKERRAHLHETFASWLVEAMGNRVREYEEVIGYHYEQAYRYRRDLGILKQRDEEVAREAVDRLIAAGRRAQGRGDLPAAVNLLSRALDLLAPENPSRLEILPDLGGALLGTGRYAEAEHVLTEAIRSGDTKTEFRALMNQVVLHTRTSSGTHEERIDDLNRAIVVFSELEDDSGASNAYRLLGYMEISRGRFEAAEEAFERSLEHAQRAGDQEAEAVARRAALDTLWLGAVPVAQAIERLKVHLAWAQQHGNRLNEAATLATLGAELAMRGEFESARGSLDQSKEILWDLGLDFYVAWISYEVSTVEFLAGEPGRAEDHLREAYATLDRMGDKGTLSTVAALLAEALYRQGSYDEAEHFTDMAEEAAAADDVMSHVRLKATRAKILATRGESSLAMSLARESVTLAEGSGFWNLHADVLMDLADITRTGTRPEEARVPTERALELYEKKGNVVAAGIARGKLSEIVAS